MNSTPDYTPQAPERSEIDALPGPTLLEFGANWCGHCQAAQAPLHSALAGYAALRHLKIEDGPGRALGRSFRVKLWPTLVFLQDGREVARLVRPTAEAPIVEGLASLHA